MSKVGRPPMFETAEQLQAVIQEYFDNPPLIDTTVTGLAVYCGFVSRQSFYDHSKRPAFKEILTNAKKKINPHCNKAKYDYKMPYSANNRMIERLKLDADFKLRFNFASLLRHHLKKDNKRTFDIVGYSVEELKRHLEQQFDSNMTWSNYGSYWHIDHIRPASSFNQTNNQEFIECWSLKNLQPLEAKTNIRKGAKLNFLTPKKAS